MEQHYGLTAEMYRAVVALVDDRMKEIQVTRQDYDRLVHAQERVEGRMDRVEAALERLAQAQARTEERVGRLEEGQTALQAAMERLAQAQARTEERVSGLEAAMERLAQAQARTEERVSGLEAAMERLAQAQARTEERVSGLEAAMERLAQAQARTEERVSGLEAAMERLAQAQARTEEKVERLESAMEKLAQAQARLSQEIGGLREDVGFSLEDVARLLLPPYLQKHHGIQLKGAPGEELSRRFFEVEGRPPIEIDLYGEGRRNGKRVVVLGEAKARIGGGAVKDFADRVQQVEPLVKGEVWRAMFGYYIHPSAHPVAEEHHILLVASYQR